jgi:amidase
MHSDSVMLRPATELAAMVRRGEITPTELLEHAITRYERHNPVINAVVVTRLELARERAKAADQAAAAGKFWGPLHGVPMTIKEAYDWEDTPSTWGNPEWANVVPSQDAPTVTRMLDAGAIIYGKTNVPLMLGDWQSFNAIYGTTNNPWDLARSPGGSSGGSAASLATGMAALEMGSDIGASIRNPAHYCGVFGHKPTMSLVPFEGHTTPGNLPEVDISVCGPMARSAGDLDLALSILAGPVGDRATGYRVALPEARQTRLSEFRVGVMLDTPVIANDTKMLDRLQSTVDALAAAGANITEAVPDIDQAEAFENYLMLLRAATGAMFNDADYAAAQAASHRWDEGDHSYQALVDHAVSMSHREWWQHHNRREGYRRKWAEYFDTYDLLLCPTAASAAFPHDHEGTRAQRKIPINGQMEPVVDQLFWAGWSCNVYLPGTTAPAGFTTDGLPVGLQIVAPYLEDRRSIRFAALMERELGGFVPAPGYE